MAARARHFRQARARRTYEGILASAAKIFPRNGYAGTMIAQIAEGAGVSIGIVYRHFLDKREIFLEMLERELEVARISVDARLRPRVQKAQDPRAIVEAVVDAIFEEAHRDPELARLYLSMSFTDADVAAIKARADAADRAVVAALLASVPRDRIPDPAAAALVVQCAAVGAAVECAIFEAADAGAVKPAVTNAICRYLLGSSEAV
ncbi:MAG TPA: TetR/AcrR family transcriptional regulator [Labilithrix sp.]